MKPWMAISAGVTLAASVLLTGPPAGAQPRRDWEGRSRANRAQPGMTPRVTRTTSRLRVTRSRTAPGVVMGTRRSFASTGRQGFRSTAFRRARVARYRRHNGRPFGYIYAAPPAYNYYYTPSVTYYSSPYSGYYYLPARHRKHRHHRYRMRVAGYRAYYTAAPPGWSHGRKRGWRGRSVPPGWSRRHKR